jgi:pimeloyl-ACP methyl ester carboxylesterase
LAASGAAAIALPGCAYLPRAAVVPMRVTALPAATGRRAPVLVVMLPGAYSLPSDFVDEGFVDALRAQRYAVDVQLVDSHLGYARNGTLLERLRDDVLQPAVQQGYRRIWLVGISLGGFASFGLLMRHADRIEGIVAISPYLGRTELIQQVATAGGAQAFTRQPRAENDPEADLWTWLGQSDAAVRDKIHLYTGSQDRFIEGQRTLGTLLAASHLQEVTGDHDWPAWKALWSLWLSRAPWPRE